MSGSGFEVSAEALGEARGRNRLDGKRIVVVGAGQMPAPIEDPPVGNGRAISILAAREGARVACVDFNREAAQATVDLIEAEGGSGVVVEADVTDPEDCERLVSESVSVLDCLHRIGRGADAGQWGARL